MSGLATKRLSVAGATSRSLVERLLAVAEAGHGRAAALLLALSLACLLPGFATLQPMDRDEPRFAQATKQMLEAGDFVDIRFQDEVRYKKPIGIHWLQAASVTAAEALGVPAARRTIALYRVPSLLGALAAVLLTYWAGLAFGGRREAFLAAALVAASLLLSVEARLAKTDAMLLACCTAAFGALARAWLGRQAGGQPGRTVAVFWAAIAFGVLIKGPMILLFLGLPAALLSWRDRSAAWLRALRPGLGLLLVLVVVLPWFLAIAVKSGGEFYRLAVGDDLLGKVTTGQQQHGAPPGFYLVAFFATFWPGAVLAAMTVPLLWRERRQDWAIFIAAGTAPAWLLFEAFPTKLPHYVLPLYPLCAIAVAVALVRGFLGPHRPGARLAFAAMPLIPAALAILLPLAAWRLDALLPVPAAALLLAATLVALLGWAAFRRGEPTRATLAGVASSCLVSATVFGLLQPALGSLKLSPRAADLVARAGCAAPEVATLGYREPSLVFLVGTGLDMVERPDEAAAFLRGPGCRVALVTGRFEEAFRAALGGEAAEPVGRVTGFNINGGRTVEIAAYAKRP